MKNVETMEILKSRHHEFLNQLDYQYIYWTAFRIHMGTCSYPAWFRTHL